jgi:hypothetical protein
VELGKLANEKKNPAKHEYLVNLIVFLSNLCMDKNFLAIKPL